MYNIKDPTNLSRNLKIKSLEYQRCFYETYCVSKIIKAKIKRTICVFIFIIRGYLKLLMYAYMNSPIWRRFLAIENLPYKFGRIVFFC